MKNCPHCFIAIQKIGETAKRLGLNCAYYDVFNDEESKQADELVKKYGDWSDDYIVPQVFFETDEGKIIHVLTGYPEGVKYTERALNNLLESRFFRSLVEHKVMQQA
jgi:glutaredoxin